VTLRAAWLGARPACASADGAAAGGVLRGGRGGAGALAAAGSGGGGRARRRGSCRSGRGMPWVRLGGQV